MRRPMLLLLLAGVLAGGGVIAWSLFARPPVGFLLSYGYPSPMGPTGHTIEVEGVEFVEVSPGYSRMGLTVREEDGLLDRAARWLGLAGSRLSQDSTWAPRTGWSSRAAPGSPGRS